MLNHPLYPLLRERDPRFSLLDQAALLAEAGVPLLQLRLKDAKDRERYDLGKPVADFCRQKGLHLVVNDRPDLALVLGARGVHLGQTDLPPAEARRLLGENLWIGWSSHNPEQLEAATDLPLNYLALGPVFATTTKANPDPVVDEDFRSRAAAETPWPLVAIGGITPERAGVLRREGYRAVAVCADLWDAEDPLARIRAYAAS